MKQTNFFQKIFSVALVLTLSFSLSNCGFNTKSGTESEVNQSLDKDCVDRVGCVHLTWDPTTQYTDGTPVQVSGYRIYYGTSSGVYDKVVDTGLRTECSIFGLAPGLYYFAATAYLKGENNSELESAKSNEASGGPNSIRLKNLGTLTVEVK